MSTYPLGVCASYTEHYCASTSRQHREHLQAEHVAVLEGEGLSGLRSPGGVLSACTLSCGDVYERTAPCLYRVHAAVQWAHCLYQVPLRLSLHCRCVVVTLLRRGHVPHSAYPLSHLVLRSGGGYDACALLVLYTTYSLCCAVGMQCTQAKELSYLLVSPLLITAAVLMRGWSGSRMTIVIEIASPALNTSVEVLSSSSSSSTL